MGGFGSVFDSSILAKDVDLDTARAELDTLLLRITATAAKDTDMATLLSRITAAVALSSQVSVLSGAAVAGQTANSVADRVVSLNSDSATLLSRITGAVALAATALSTAQWTNARAAALDYLTGPIPSAPSHYENATDSAVAGASGAYGTYRQLIASTAFALRYLCVNGYVIAGAANRTDIQFAYGAAGFEVPFCSVAVYQITGAQESWNAISFLASAAAGQRISWRAKSDSATAATVAFQADLYEA